MSNAEVLATARQPALSTVLLERQLRLYGDVARKGSDDPLRAAVFEDGVAVLRSVPGARKQGRPRNTWATVVHNHALAAAGGHEPLQQTVMEPTMWTAAVRRYCFEDTALHAL